MLATYLLRLEGVEVLDRRARARWRPAGGACRRLRRAVRLDGGDNLLAALREEVGWLRSRHRGDRRRAGHCRQPRHAQAQRVLPACSASTRARRTCRFGGRVIGVDAILENRVVFGSVNAHRRDWSPPSTRSTAGGRAGPTRLPRSWGCVGHSTGSTRHSTTAGSRRRWCCRNDGFSTSRSRSPPDGAERARAFLTAACSASRSATCCRPSDPARSSVQGRRRLRAASDAGRRASARANRTSAWRSTMVSPSCARSSRPPASPRVTATELLGRPRFTCRDPFGNLIELARLHTVTAPRSLIEPKREQ